jgi:hypothetical protein
MTISVPGKLGEVSHALEMSGAGGFAWYQTLLGLSKSAPARDYFGQILDADGTVLLCFHQWGTHRYPPSNPTRPTAE